MSPAEPVRREVLWTTFGIAVPLLAFLLDAGMQVNPVLWGPFDGVGGARPALDGRQVIVYGLLALSMLGLVVLMTSRSRGARALALPLLGLGVLMAGLHALVFVPLVPLSFFAVLFLGLGLLGFTPFAALVVYAHALSVAVREQRAACRGQAGRWLVAPLLATALPVLGTVGPYLHARAIVDGLRGADPPAVSRGFRQLGALAHLVRGELTTVYGELDGPAQARMRNLFLERFDRDVHEELGFLRLR
ncbi:MAG: hypothetical protein KF878_25615 [Planctomycetes bacterium]|nr:hypothetical protein [Planctomycetota bacterium]